MIPKTNLKNLRLTGYDDHGEALYELTGREKAGIYGGLTTGTVILTILIAVLVPRCCPAITPAELDRLIPALIQVESRGNDRAIGDSGKAVGALQLWPIMVEDVNRIAGTRYTLADRFDRRKSEEMVRIYLTHYARNKTIEQAARIHNGGPTGDRKEATKKYWEKVRKELR